MPLRSIAHSGVVEFVEEGHDVSSSMKGMAHLSSIRSISRQQTVQHYNLKRVANGSEAVKGRGKA